MEKRDVKKDKRKYAYGYIKDKIIKGEFKPLRLLNESELGRSMDGISRTPVRDALNQLVYEGFVKSIPGKGMFVVELHIDDLLEIYEARLPLECTAIILFTRRASEKELELLDANLERYGKAAKEADHMACISADTDFHRVIAKGSKNGRLYSMITCLLEHAAMGSCTGYSGFVKSYEEHRLIYDAIKACDEYRANSLMQTHLACVVQQLTFDRLNEHSMLDIKDWPALNASGRACRTAGTGRAACFKPEGRHGK